MEQITRKSGFFNPLQGVEGINLSTVERKAAINNPFVKWRTIPVTIKRYFTDVDGAVLDKNDVAIPAALKVEYPFFVFGDFDRNGGYGTALKAMGPVPGTFYLTSFVNGNGMTAQQFTGFTGFNTVRNFIGYGDIVHIFTDNVNAPNFFVWVVMSNKYGPLSSIISNSSSIQRDGLVGKIYIEHFNYYTDNGNGQWAIPLHFTRSTNVSTWGDQQVMPYIFRNPYTEQDGFIKVDCNFNLDQFQTLGTYFLFDTETINLNFRLLPH